MAFALCKAYTSVLSKGLLRDSLPVQAPGAFLCVRGNIIISWGGLCSTVPAATDELMRGTDGVRRCGAETQSVGCDGGGGGLFYAS